MIAVWLACKEAERLATEARRVVEDAMIEQFKIAKDMEGTKTFMNLGYTVKIAGRLNHKIDSDKLFSALRGGFFRARIGVKNGYNNIVEILPSEKEEI